MLRPTRLWIRPGWQPLAEVALNRLGAIGLDEVLEVKEKLGSLRIIVRPKPSLADDVRKIVAEARERSLTVCDMCGAPGYLREGAWRRTRCDIHADDEAP